jgi:aspartyl protease family protein
MFRIAIAAMVMLAAGVVAVRLVDQTGRAPAVAMTAAPAPVPANSNSRSLTVNADQGGHFAVDARVDGRRLGFMIDTGASQITIRASDAARLGFHPTPRDYSIKISTANGEGRAALVELGMVEVGNIVVRDLRALVVPDTALNVNLLGMTFLSRLRWSHERGKLLLEQ